MFRVSVTFVHESCRKMLRLLAINQSGHSDRIVHSLSQESNCLESCWRVDVFSNVMTTGSGDLVQLIARYRGVGNFADPPADCMVELDFRTSSFEVGFQSGIIKGERGNYRLTL